MTDVVVLGGGPAGCSAAGLLAAWGHSVVLLTREHPPAAHLVESIPPSARKLLGTVGALDAVESGGFFANEGNSVWWAGRPARAEIFADDARGFHAERGALESVFQAYALRAGATVRRGVVARAVVEDGAGWTVRCARGTPAAPLHARWVLDATGRSGLLSRRAQRSVAEEPTTLALVGRWTRPAGWSDSEAAHAWVESYPEGWAWSVPISRTERCVAAMVDPERTTLERGRGVRAMYNQELSRTTELSRRLSDAAPVGVPWACPASAYDAARRAWPGLLLIGDAGSFIDPLSSYGVKKAVASGWLAAVAVNTAFAAPDMAEEAGHFFEARERSVSAAYRRQSGPFFREAAETYRRPFWEARADAAERSGEEAGSGDAADEGAESPLPRHDVLAAYEGLRARPSLSAVAGGSLRSVRRAAVEGNRIVLEEHLATGRCPEGLRLIRGVDVRQLIAVAPLHPEVPDAWDAYNAVARPVSLPDFLLALATAFAAGLLEHRS